MRMMSTIASPSALLQAFAAAFSEARPSARNAATARGPCSARRACVSTREVITTSSANNIFVSAACTGATSWTSVSISNASGNAAITRSASIRPLRFVRNARVTPPSTSVRSSCVTRRFRKSTRSRPLITSVARSAQSINAHAERMAAYSNSTSA